MIPRFTRFILTHKWIAYSLGLAILILGALSNPFQPWTSSLLPSAGIQLSAIPDLGENQQIISTAWPGHSAEEVETYLSAPLSAALMGSSGVTNIRSSSMEGLSLIYLHFEEEVSTQDARQEITQQLFSLHANTLPPDVSPSLGPVSTPLGLIYAYTLEGVDKHGKPAAGWDLHDIRNYQDQYLKPELESISGVAEVAGVGGYQGEYQVILDPRKAHLYQVSISDILQSLNTAGEEVSLGEIAGNGIRYSLYFNGNFTEASELAKLPLLSKHGLSLELGQVATVQLGPARRRGALDHAGREVVGGMIYMQEGEQAMSVISAIEDKINQLTSSLPQQRLANGESVYLTILPYYDVSTLILEVLGTLSHTLLLEVIISFLVILLALRSMKLSLTVSLLLPVSILSCFVLMNAQGMEAHLLSLAGIALAIGSVVDMGIILGEQSLRLIREGKFTDHEEAIISATGITGPALLTSVGTTIISFLPILLLQQAEGKMFGPLAITKTYILLGSLLCTFILLPVALSLLWKPKSSWEKLSKFLSQKNLLIGMGILGLTIHWHAVFLLLAGILSTKTFSYSLRNKPREVSLQLVGLCLFFFLQLANIWHPWGLEIGEHWNFLLLSTLVLSYLAFLYLLYHHYEQLLARLIQHSQVILQVFVGIFLLALVSWIGLKPLQGIFPQLAGNPFYQQIASYFPGLSKGYLPHLNEGAFLYMPSSATHVAFSENVESLRILDRQLAAIPEVKQVVGKLGRANSALDPAPISMFETYIGLQPEYVSDAEGRPIKIKLNAGGTPIKDEHGHYLPTSRGGDYYRLWRPHIRSEADIWEEIQQLSRTGISKAPKLYPIESRQLMQLTGVNTPLALLVKGDHVDSLEKAALILEKFLRDIPEIEQESIYRQSFQGLPSLSIEPDYRSLRTHGLSLASFQKILSTYLSGTITGTSRQNRATYPIRVQIGRAYREDPIQLKNLPLTLPSGKMVCLGELAAISYRPGPAVIKGENSFMATYLTFGQEPGTSVVGCAERVERRLATHMKEGSLALPHGARVELIGTYRQQQAAADRLSIVIPLCLLLIILILYLQFRSFTEIGMLGMGIMLSCCGGILFMAFWQLPLVHIPLFQGASLAEALQVPKIELGVASWVGFIALIGISVDDGVILLTYLKREIQAVRDTNKYALRQAVITAGKLRVKPCLMTTATTVLALLPILTSNGKGAEVMKPIALPLIGGMLLEVCTLFLIPILYLYWKEKSSDYA